MRCQEIKGSRDLFGGMSVILFGDVLQLPPVKAPHVFSNLQPNDIRRYFNSVMVGNINLWKQFVYAELTQNMRQRGDLAYAEIMGRMRVQQLTDDDIETLKSRLIPLVDPARTFEEAANYYIQQQQTDDKILAIFATNEEVGKFNAATIEALGLQTVDVEAEDSWSSRPRAGAYERPYQQKQYSIVNQNAGSTRPTSKSSTHATAAGLDQRLVLAVGGRIMLRRNINKSLGLINGSTGVLQEIVYESDENVRPARLRVSVSSMFVFILRPVF